MYHYFIRFVINGKTYSGIFEFPSKVTDIRSVYYEARHRYFESNNEIVEEQNFDVLVFNFLHYVENN